MTDDEHPENSTPPTHQRPVADDEYDFRRADIATDDGMPEAPDRVWST